MAVIIKKALSEEDIQHCMNIRFKVFVEGQHVPINEEVDGKDGKAFHYLLSVDENPAGVARVRCLDQHFKIERIGITDEYQGKGLGRNIMQFILADLMALSMLNKVKLSSQTHAIAFYEKFGFAVCSDEYMDAGIPHKDMQLVF